MTKLPDRTHLSKKLKTMMMSQEELDRIAYEKKLAEFESDEDE